MILKLQNILSKMFGITKSSNSLDIDDELDENMTLTLNKEELLDIYSALNKADEYCYMHPEKIGLHAWAIKTRNQIFEKSKKLLPGEEITIPFTEEDDDGYYPMIRFFMSEFENEISDESWSRFHVICRKLGWEIAAIT